MTKDIPTEILYINDNLAIPLAELRYRFARSSGPGGQNVNHTSTRVELLYDVRQSASLSEAQRVHILHRLRHNIDQEGILHLFSQVTRSQLRNRQEVTARFAALLAESLYVSKSRVATRPTRASQQRRVGTKRARSRIKALRGQIPADEE